MSSQKARPRGLADLAAPTECIHGYYTYVRYT